MHLLPAHDGKTELAAAFLKRQARSLYWRGWPMADIAEELDIKYQTLASWKNRGKWDDASPRQVIEDRIEAKIASYLDMPDFNEGHMKRVDFLTRQMERMARIGKFESSGKEGDLNPKIARRNDDAAKAKRAEKRKNFLTLDQWQALLDDFHDRNFAYQAGWWEQRDQRTRKILKSRQIGATWYFAREALAKIADDVLAGEQPRNQIFLSASRRQANKFRREIVGWVKRVTGVDLQGDPIMLDFGGLETEDGEPVGGGLDPVGLYPMSTNSNTSQGESGDFYFDEFFWAQGFAQAPPLVRACAASWVRLNRPRWDVRLLAVHNLSSYGVDPTPASGFAFPPRRTSSQLADVVRTELLRRYGGMWADATVFPTQPIEPNLSFDHALVQKLRKIAAVPQQPS